MLGKAQQKSGRDFESVALPHIDSLYATGLRMTRDPREAEDLVQDTMLAAYRFFDRFEPGTNCKAWLFKILTNTFINKYRKRVREREVRDVASTEDTPSLMSEDVAHASRDPEGKIVSALLSDDVKRALEAVPHDYRMAVILCDLEDFSYKEIAEIMDCPVGTVMSRLHRGRRMLQKTLRDYAVKEGIVKGADVIPFPSPNTAGEVKKP
jgi:RNA polymerase sigma-70 factor, ECF subfamily